MKGKIKVEFISEQGYLEAGIDGSPIINIFYFNFFKSYKGGGLFKEFLDAFAKQAFDPMFGLFVPTTAQMLTPNPTSSLSQPRHLQYFQFIGKMLGKALYEVDSNIRTAFLFDCFHHKESSS
jgi:ubiquitin-protein ligase E3 C